MKRVIIMAVLLAAGVGLTQPGFAHCEIPCGIYDDQARVASIREHSHTIEKAMNKIKTLRKEEETNYNQLVRWITNKEEHANKLQTIVYQYFLNQRVKPVTDKDSDKYQAYVQQVTLLHRMLVQTMKCKQTTDPAHVKKVRSLLDQFEKVYFKDHGHNH